MAKLNIRTSDIIHAMRILSAAFISLLLFATHSASLAHLKDDPGFPCFKMENQQVVEIENPLTNASFAMIEQIEALPNWVSTFNFGQQMHFEVKYRVAHCRPFNIFAAPIYEATAGISQFTTPSPTYNPIKEGNDHHDSHTASFGFTLTDEQVSLDSLNVTGVRITINEYGSGKLLAEETLPLNAIWQRQRKSIIASEQCTEAMHWPPVDSATHHCENSSTFELKAGFRVVDHLDLNSDGICELAVEVESCRKLNNNTCYKIYSEHNGFFQEIWQYYNDLKVFTSENNYYRLGSTETGPNQDVHRLGRYDPLQSRYVTERYLSPCR